GGHPGDSESGTSDPSLTYSSSKWRENSRATPSISRHSRSVTGRASAPKRSSSARSSRTPRSASGNSRSSQTQSARTSAAAGSASGVIGAANATQAHAATGVHARCDGGYVGSNPADRPSARSETWNDGEAIDRHRSMSTARRSARQLNGIGPAQVPSGL